MDVVIDEANTSVAAAADAGVISPEVVAWIVAAVREAVAAAQLQADRVRADHACRGPEGCDDQSRYDAEQAARWIVEAAGQLRDQVVRDGQADAQLVQILSDYLRKLDEIARQAGSNLR